MTVFQLVKRMKGTIKVLSKINNGTSVILSFPVYKGEGKHNNLHQPSEVRPSLR
jgi:two-component system, sporulation sensor kinase B